MSYTIKHGWPQRDADGVMVNPVTDEDYLAWVAAGNTPAPEIPAPVYSCTPWQIRKALSSIGLRQAVEGAVAASADQVLKDGWEFASAFRSDDPFVVSMGAALGKTPEETAEIIKLAGRL